MTALQAFEDYYRAVRGDLLIYTDLLAQGYDPALHAELLRKRVAMRNALIALDHVAELDAWLAHQLNHLPA